MFVLGLFSGELIAICGDSTGAIGSGAVGTDAGAIGLIGLTGFVTFVTLFTQVFAVSIHVPHVGWPYGSGQVDMRVCVIEPVYPS